MSEACGTALIARARRLERIPDADLPALVEQAKQVILQLDEAVEQRYKVYCQLREENKAARRAILSERDRDRRREQKISVRATRGPSPLISRYDPASSTSSWRSRGGK